MTRKKPHKLKRFIVHLAAQSAGEIQLFIEDLAAKRRLKIIDGHGTHFQTIEIRSTHRSLRRFQKTVPRNIYVSYEEQRP